MKKNSCIFVVGFLHPRNILHRRQNTYANVLKQHVHPIPCSWWHPHGPSGDTLLRLRNKTHTPIWSPSNNSIKRSISSRWLMRSVYTRAGFTLPTGPAKPAGFGTGIPDRFGRKPVQVKFKFKILCANGSYRYTGRFDRFTGRFDRFTGRFD